MREGAQPFEAVESSLSAQRVDQLPSQSARAVPTVDDERPDFSTDPDLLKVRNDDLWNFGGGLVWGFAPGWSLRSTFEYNWEDSSIAELAYSSTELWLTVRKSF